MFKKPPSHISPSTPIRSSDRRKLLSAILAQYGLDTESEIVDDQLIDKVDWRGLVPDGIRSGKIRTSAEIPGVIYSSDHGDPLWMTLGRDSTDYIPTLYTTLATPGHLLPLPLLPLHSPPPPPFLAGAPLFIPAILNLSQPHLLPSVPEGGLVYYMTLSPSDPSKCRILGIARMVAAGGLKGAWERWERARRVLNKDGMVGVEDVGRVCETLNMVGDSLWEMGSKPELPYIDIPPFRSSLVPATNQEPTSSAFSSPRPLQSPSQPPIADDLAPSTQLDALDISSNPQLSPASALTALSTSEIDALLSVTLHQSLLVPPPLPIPASSLYSQFILPNRPASIPAAQRAEVVVGKSSWKKVGKWMKGCEKEGIIGGKERSGEYIITSVNASHDLLQSHRPHKTIAKEESQQASSSSAVASSSSEAQKTNGAGELSLVEEFWRPSSSGIGFWEGCGAEKSTYLSHPQIVACLNDYVTKNSLTTPTDRALITLDQPLLLATGLLKASKTQMPPTTGPPSRSTPAGIVTLRREPLLQHLKSQMSAYHRIGTGDIKKGEIKPVMMAVKTRQGRKTVTIVTGLESWGLDPETVGEDLKRICAGSATVSPLSGAAQKLNLQEIMIQGSQTKAVTDYLMGKGVPKKWVKEEAEGGGKGGGGGKAKK